MKNLKNAARMGLALCLSFNLVASSTRSVAVPLRQDTNDAATEPQTSLLTPVFFMAGASPAASDTLRFYNIHTGERLTISRREGDPVTRRANWFMRDFRSGEAANLDPALLDLLGDIRQEILRRHPGMRVEFHVVSSYRSRATNDSLRNAGGDQAKNSQHTLGKAMDIRVPGVSTRELRDIATCLGVGGVGYYATDRFVHVDTGRVRYWPSRAYLPGVKCA